MGRAAWGWQFQFWQGLRMVGGSSGQQWSREELGPGRRLGVAWSHVSVTRRGQSDGDPRDLGVVRERRLHPAVLPVPGRCGDPRAS